MPEKDSNITVVLAGREQVIEYDKLNLSEAAANVTNEKLIDAVRKHLGLKKPSLSNMTITRSVLENAEKILVSPSPVAG